MDKLNHTLPQIRVGQETRFAFDKMALETRRSISNLMQLITEDIAKSYIKTGIICLTNMKLIT